MKTRFKYRDVAILDCKKGEEPSATEVARFLKSRGYNAKRGYSPYCGCVCVTLSFNNLKELRSALKALKAEDIVDDIDWRVKQICSDLVSRADYAGYYVG